jgi:hypothetical protein
VATIGARRSHLAVRWQSRSDAPWGLRYRPRRVAAGPSQARLHQRSGAVRGARTSPRPNGRRSTPPWAPPPSAPPWRPPSAVRAGRGPTVHGGSGRSRRSDASDLMRAAPCHRWAVDLVGAAPAGLHGGLVGVETVSVIPVAHSWSSETDRRSRGNTGCGFGATAMAPPPPRPESSHCCFRTRNAKWPQ